MRLPLLIIAMASVAQLHAQVPDALQPRGSSSQSISPEVTPRPAAPDVKAPDIKISPRSSSGSSNGEKEKAGGSDQERTLSHPPAESAPRGTDENQQPRPFAGEENSSVPGR